MRAHAYGDHPRYHEAGYLEAPSSGRHHGAYCAADRFLGRSFARHDGELRAKAACRVRTCIIVEWPAADGRWLRVQDRKSKGKGKGKSKSKEQKFSQSMYHGRPGDNKPEGKEKGTEKLAKK